VTGFAVVLSSVLSGAFLAAIVTAGINIWLARRSRYGDERSRVRAALADAFAAYAAYKELPYAIRRRRADTPAEERVRLSEILRKIQTDLAYHQAWTAAESEVVGTAYAELVRETRKIAGAAMHEAWAAPAARTDAAMSIPMTTIDLSSLNSCEVTYMRAAQIHLAHLSPWWAR
jgi:hypothetical protein